MTSLPAGPTQEQQGQKDFSAELESRLPSLTSSKQLSLTLAFNAFFGGTVTYLLRQSLGPYPLEQPPLGALGGGPKREALCGLVKTTLFLTLLAPDPTADALDNVLQSPVLSQ